MALAIKDMVRGTIVDWREKYDPEERQTTLRDPWMRGIIVRVVGAANDAVSEVWVKFRDDEDEIKVSPRELTRYLPWNSKRARRELARIEGNRELIGTIYDQRPAKVKPKGVDRLGLTNKPAPAVVQPEYDEESDVQSENVPIVIPDVEAEEGK